MCPAPAASLRRQEVLVRLAQGVDRNALLARRQRKGRSQRQRLYSIGRAGEFRYAGKRDRVCAQDWVRRSSLYVVGGQRPVQQLSFKLADAALIGSSIDQHGVGQVFHAISQ